MSHVRFNRVMCSTSMFIGPRVYLFDSECGNLNHSNLIFLRIDPKHRFRWISNLPTCNKWSKQIICKLVYICRNKHQYIYIYKYLSQHYICMIVGMCYIYIYITVLYMYDSGYVHYIHIMQVFIYWRPSDGLQIWLGSNYFLTRIPFSMLMLPSYHLDRNHQPPFLSFSKCWPDFEAATWHTAPFLCASTFLRIWLGFGGFGELPFPKFWGQ